MKKYKIGFLARLILGLSVTILAAFLVMAVSTQIFTRNTLQENAIQTGLQNVRTQTTFLEINLEQLRQLSNNLYSNADVYALLHESAPTNYQNYRISLFLRSLMSMTVDVKPFQIYLDIFSSGQSYLIGQTGAAYGPSRYHVAMPDGLLPGAVYGDGPRLSSTYGYSLGGAGTPVYSFHWNLYDSAQTKVLGSISFDIAVYSLENLVSFFDSDTAREYLLLKDGEIMFASRDPLTAQTAKDLIAVCAKTGWADISTKDFSGIAFLSSANLDDLQLYLMQMIPYSELYGEANRVFYYNLCIILAAFSLCCIVVILFVRQLTKPLRELDSYVTAVNRDGLACRVGDYVNYCADDELGHLIVHTEKMMETINEMFQRQEQLSRAQRVAEAKMLQAQINPHFLYNSLQSVASVALQHGDKETWKYITMLGTRMQYSMNLEQSTATLRQEVQYVTDYVTLQDVRFGKNLRMYILLSPEAESIIVPKMILQPLAENAFKHGQLCRQKDGYFMLNASIEVGVLKIVVEDNGLGCPPQRLAALNHDFETVDMHEGSMKDGIGLMNVLCRLKLFFGADSNLCLDTPKNGGLRVTVTIPLRNA